MRVLFEHKSFNEKRIQKKINSAVALVISEGPNPNTFVKIRKKNYKIKTHENKINKIKKPDTTLISIPKMTSGSR